MIPLNVVKEQLDGKRKSNLGGQKVQFPHKKSGSIYEKTLVLPRRATAPVTI